MYVKTLEGKHLNVCCEKVITLQVGATKSFDFSEESPIKDVSDYLNDIQ